MDKKEKDFQEKLLSIFRVEAAEHIQVLSSGLVELERSRTAEERLKVIETIFREAHSLKGAARAVGLGGIESMCQAAESVLAALKRQEIHLSPTLFDVLHDAVDAIGKLLPSDENNAISHGKLPVRDLLRRLETALKGNEALSEKSDAKAEAAPQDQAQQAFLPTSLEEKTVVASTVRIATAKLDAVLFQAEELLSAKLAAFQRVAEIRETVGELATLKKEQARIAPTRKAFQQAWDKAGKRNGFDKAEPQLHKLLEFMASEASALKSFEARLAALAKSAEHDQRSLGTLVDGLLEDMKKVLMLPISSALEMFPKMVRDLSRDKGKEVKLVVAGGEIEIDRRILEEVRDPLVHLIRNCIDHGVETPEVRQGANKPPQGTVTLAMTQRNGNKIEILVSDDGAGIDLSKVREAARKLGLVAPEDANRPALLPLVFQSGVSTAPIITDLSGRGLGLAIVREKVEKLGGIVSVETDPGRGTTFHIVLPLTLATFRGVHVRVNDQQFVLPSTHVEQGVRLKREVIKTVENRETIPWKGEAVALVRLADVLELPRMRVDGAANDIVQAIILGSASQRIAFGVDEILSEQEVLVKPLGKQLS
ncbi:MAG: chemotaxis protein CheA, partial [Burkholderiales bacterium]